MKVLLDTHALLWYALNDPQLSSIARRTIETDADKVYASPASYWELAIKASLGKLVFARPFHEFVAACDVQFPLLPISTEHTVHLAGMPFPGTHRDPFDRLLVSQALVEGLTVVSRDAALDLYGVPRIW